MRYSSIGYNLEDADVRRKQERSKIKYGFHKL